MPPGLSKFPKSPKPAASARKTVKPPAALLPVAILGSLLALSVEAQIQHGCAPVQATEFRITTVVNRTAGDLNEPVKLDFDMDAEGNVDIYWVERTGRVRKYDAKTKQSMVVGRPADVFSGDEHGLNGIALDPAFKQNRNVFLFHSVTGVGFRVMRYTLTSAFTLDMASAKVVLEIKGNSRPTDWHTGGAMKFDDQGNLFISVGENKSYEVGPPNTNDLRGKILRIRPKADGTYDIPEGNLFPPGTDKTRPEVYVMGTRNAYTIDYDNKTKRLLWGCVGPDGTGANTEEHNMTSVPGFFGWPYFAGQNHVIMAGKNPLSPVNSATTNTGLQALPPAKGSFNYYPQAAAITGPVYRYTNVNSAIKLPPHFDGVWFASDFNKASIDTIGVNAAGSARTGYARILTGLRLDRPTDFKQGPDGALYIVNYSGYFSTVASTAIVRLEYTGNCRPITSGVKDVRTAAREFTARGWSLSLREAGSAVRVADLGGRTLYSAPVAGHIHDLAPALHGRAGLYIVTVDAPSGARTRKLALPAP